MFSVRETDICSSVTAWQRPQKCLDSLWPIKYPYLSHITLAGTVNTAGGQSNELCLMSLKFISSMLVVLASWCVQRQRNRTTISRPERNLPAWQWQIKVLPPPAEWWALLEAILAWKLWLLEVSKVELYFLPGVGFSQAGDILVNKIPGFLLYFRCPAPLLSSSHCLPLPIPADTKGGWEICFMAYCLFISHHSLSVKKSYAQSPDLFEGDLNIED